MGKFRRVQKQFRRSCEVVGAGLAIGVVLFCSPILIPFACYSAAKTAKEQDEVANKSLCEKCQHPLGTAAITLATETESKRRAAFMAAHPNSKCRFVSRWQAICVDCNAGYSYNAKTKRFEFVEFVDMPVNPA